MKPSASFASWPRRGFRTINLPAFPQNPNGWSTTSEVKALKAGQIAALTGDPKGELQYWQPEFDRLWAEVCDLDLALTMHLGGRVPRFGEKQFFLPDMPMSKMAMAEPVAIFIFNAIFQRFPKLRLATVESGVGWFAWFNEYITRTWEKQRFWTESPLTESPTYYMETERLRLVHPGPHRHPLPRPPRRQKHHVVIRLSAFGNHLPALARDHSARFRRRAGSGDPRDHP